jgi:peptidoglycan/xylan/chitin deacetylase (PgdA/CDA1 family)
MMSALVISLDFELFWGVAESKTIESYGKNVEGVWQAIPAMLALFAQHNVRATWATVGMLMCKDYQQWSDITPAVMPTYTQDSSSTYSVAHLAKQFPKLFFARPLVEQIQASAGQELASHSYSHFYCSDASTTVEQFIADLDCTKIIFDDCGITQPTSFVFPRNQSQDDYVNALAQSGFTAYRGNQDHWLYHGGSVVPYGIAGRMLRLADSYLSITGHHVAPVKPSDKQLINIPASRFLRPVAHNTLVNKMQVRHLKQGMLAAAKNDGIFHLWWHPHNFGVSLAENIALLDELLQYFSVLQDNYGMRSLTMADVAETVKTPKETV